MELQYRAYNKEQLLAYVKEEKYGSSKHVAISHHRAVSQYYNPRCRHDDIIMLMVWDHDHLVAYLGILPDDLYLHSSESIHIGWLSCLWVNPDYRGLGVAGKLLKMALDAYGNYIILTEYTAEAGRLYEKSGLFAKLKTLKGSRYYYRSCLAKILPQKHRFFSLIKPLLKFTDHFFNLIFDLRFSGREIPTITAHFSRSNDIQKISNDISAFACQNSSFKRGFIEFEWILKYPWLIPESKDFDYQKKYFFSAIDPGFENLFYQHNTETSSFAWMTLRNGHLKLVYNYHGTGDVDLFEKIVLSGNTDMFSCYDSSVNQNFGTLRKKALFSKKIYRNYMVSKELYGKIPDPSVITIADGDGDCAFT
jgi:GNAT superfamily N-acetyltransferase